MDIYCNIFLIISLEFTGTKPLIKEVFGESLSIIDYSNYTDKRSLTTER
jgi:hypothetical protein